MQILLTNKKISLKYEILETFQAGISLLGHEVKSLKSSQGSLDGAYVIIKIQNSKFQVLLKNLTIPPYQPSNQSPTYNAERDRVLLLNKKEILSIERQLHNRGTTIVPKSIGVERGQIKVTIALVRGKKKHDKRQDIKKRDQERDILREIKTHFS